MTFRPTQIEIGEEFQTSAGGDWLPYSFVALVAEVDGWRCTRRIVSGEHWEPSIDRAVALAQEEHGIAPDQVFDLREGA